MADTSPQCAVWYMRYGGAAYELCDDEQSAVQFAYALADQEEGAVSGVQFADGRLVERDDWQALSDYEDERYRAWRDSVANAPVVSTPSTRRAFDPFGGNLADAVDLRLGELGCLLTMNEIVEALARGYGVEDQ